MADAVYSLEQIDSWQSQMGDFAKTPRTRFSKKEAVEALIEVIEEALQAHHYEEVAAKLTEWGLEIAPGSLKQYVNAYRREHRGEDDAASTATRRRSSKKRAKSGSKASASKVAASAAEESVDKATDTSAGNRSEKAASGQSDKQANRAERKRSERATRNTARNTDRDAADSAASKPTSRYTPNGFLEMAEDL